MQQKIAHVLRHAAFDLEPHRLAEAAAAQLRFDRAQQIVGFVFLQVEVGVARDAEEVRVAHVQSREEPVEVVRDQIFEQARSARSPGGPPSTGTKRGSVGGIFTRAKCSSTPSRVVSSSSTASESDRFEMYGNGWPLSTASGVSTGKTVSSNVPLERGLRLVVELAHAQQPNALALERRQQLVVEQAHLLRQRRAQLLRDRREVFGRRAAVLGAAHDLRLDLLLDRGDANHEELVEIRSVDRDELQPLEQRIARVERLLEHAIVELQP